MESCPTQAVLPLVGLAPAKVIRDRYIYGFLPPHITKIDTVQPVMDTCLTPFPADGTTTPKRLFSLDPDSPSLKVKLKRPACTSPLNI
ncbi:MAG: hypothetical protein ACQESR_10955 [Planctomycetota bacterium]